MYKFLKLSWWALLLRGFSAILFGLFAMLWPGITLEVLILIFGIYALVDGLFSAAAAIIHRKHDSTWRLFFLAGIVGAVVGGLTLLLPGLTALVLIYFIAARNLIVGIIEIIYALAVLRENRKEWVYILNGLISVLFGGVLFALPGAGTLALVTIIGAFAVVVGILLLVVALRARQTSGENHLDMNGIR